LEEATSEAPSSRAQIMYSLPEMLGIRSVLGWGIFFKFGSICIYIMRYLRTGSTLNTKFTYVPYIPYT
jgi:hypothetical protein